MHPHDILSRPDAPPWHTSSPVRWHGQSMLRSTHDEGSATPLPAGYFRTMSAACLDGHAGWPLRPRHLCTCSVSAPAGMVERLYRLQHRWVTLCVPRWESVLEPFPCSSLPDSRAEVALDAQAEGSEEWTLREHLVFGESTIAGVRNRFCISPAAGMAPVHPLPHSALHFQLIHPTPEPQIDPRMWGLPNTPSHGVPLNTTLRRCATVRHDPAYTAAVRAQQLRGQPAIHTSVFQPTAREVLTASTPSAGAVLLTTRAAGTVRACQSKCCTRPSGCSYSIRHGLLQGAGGPERVFRTAGRASAGQQVHSRWEAAARSRTTCPTPPLWQTRWTGRQWGLQARRKRRPSCPTCSGCATAAAHAWPCRVTLLRQTLTLLPRTGPGPAWQTSASAKLKPESPRRVVSCPCPTFHMCSPADVSHTP